ncbi:hypothetical protein ACWDA7_39985 [Streptomyces sp. NPDC001156]
MGHVCGEGLEQWLRCDDVVVYLGCVLRGFPHPVVIVAARGPSGQEFQDLSCTRCGVGQFRSTRDQLVPVVDEGLIGSVVVGAQLFGSVVGGTGVAGLEDDLVCRAVRESCAANDLGHHVLGG